MLPNLQADMTITADVVEEEEDTVVEDMEAVGTVVDVMIMADAVEAGEDMAVAAVTVSFCLYPHQGLLLFVLHP
jgi:hypothetical protein